MTRLLRSCSEETEYNKIQKKMYEIFTDRGYPPNLIKKVQQQVTYPSRTAALSQKVKEPCKYDTFLVTEYTPDLNVKTLKKLLTPKPEEEPHVPIPCVSLKKNKTLGKTLVRAKLKEQSVPEQCTTPIIIPMTPNLEGHSAGCGIHGCKCCKTMSRKSRVISNTNHKSFATPKHSICNTRNIIYLLECSKCTTKNQYVGQTQRSLSQRLGGHRAASRIKTNLPLYKHFITRPNHNFERDAKLTILEKTQRDTLTDRESHWIKTLDTIYPKGLNSRYE